MNVLLVNKFNYIKGGAAHYFVSLAESLKDNGAQVAKFCMSHPQNMPDENEKYFVNYIDFSNFKLKNTFKYINRVLYSREAAKKFEKLILNFKPDIIHLHNFYHQISPSIIPVAKRHNIPIVMHLHDYKIICPNYKLYSQNEICYKCKDNKYYNCVKRRCLNNSISKSFLAMAESYLHNVLLKTYKKVDLFIAPSQFMKNICVEFGVPSKKIKVVYNSVDLGKYHPSNSLIDENGYLLYVGRLSNEKGVHLLVKAMKKVSKKTKLKIVGIGPELKNIKELINKLGLNQQIEMLGFEYGKKLIEIIGKAKAIIISSVLPENMPLSMLEAIAMGKIVIAPNAGGIPEVIKNKENGFLFEASNSDDLSDKMNNLNKFNLNLVSKKARETALKFDQSSHLGEITDIYDCIIKDYKKT